MQINVTTGLKEIEISRNGEMVGSIWFSPADPALLDRLRKVSERAREMQTEAAISADVSLEEALDRSAELDKQVRDLIDWAFDYPASDIVFGSSFCFTSDGGTSMLEQFLAGATAYIEQETKSEIEASRSHQAKYLGKYCK